MSVSSREFQLHHPWLWVLGLVCGMFLLIGLACAPVFGWIELRFSPLQRNYLTAYLQSSVGAMTNGAPQYVEWIEKKGPGRDWEIARPEDLVPSRQVYPPFQLSPAAQAEGWNDLGYNTAGTFEQRDIRDTLQTKVFDGHSLLYFVLQPFEMFLAGFLCWKMFDRWREQQARERGNRWGTAPQFNPWDEDLRAFLKQLAQGTGKAAIQVGRWVEARRQSMRRPAATVTPGVTVSPSGVASITPVLGPAATAPNAVKVAEATPAPRPKPPVPAAKPSPAATPKPQQSATKPVPSSPFGKPAAGSEPASKWDISQWID